MTRKGGWQNRHHPNTAELEREVRRLRGKLKQARAMREAKERRLRDRIAELEEQVEVWEGAEFARTFERDTARQTVTRLCRLLVRRNNQLGAFRVCRRDVRRALRESGWTGLEAEMRELSREDE